MIMELDRFIYPAMILLAILANCAVYTYYFHKNRISTWILLACLLANVLYVPIFAVLLSLALSGFKRFGGLTSIGGLIGLLGATIFNVISFKEHRNTIIKSLYISIPLMYSIGKIGCHFSGCCRGMEYDGPFAVTYDGCSFFPVQMTEVIAFFIIFVTGLFLLRNMKDGNKLAFIGICAGTKFALDFLRERDSLISPNQIMCVGIFLIFAGLFAYRRRKQRNA